VQPIDRLFPHAMALVRYSERVLEDVSTLTETTDPGASQIARAGFDTLHQFLSEEV
jgi:hypothetical protein